MPGASQHRPCFPARSRANAFCRSRLQARIAGASHQIDQRWRSISSADSTTQVRGCSERALATVWRTFFRPHLPKVLHAPQFFQHFAMPIELSLRSPAHSFSQTLPDRATSPHPASASPRSHISKKTQGFCAQARFNPYIRTLSNCYTSSQLLDDTWLT